MSNSKISALSSASTPLTGSEVVPLNQSGTTVKAIVTDFTNAIAITPTNITTTGTNSSSNTIGFQMTGAANQDYRFAIPGVADWRLRGNYASGNFDVVLNGTVLGGFTLGGNFHFSGNATVDTAGKGINFTANTPASGMTSQLLNWYEEGTWTPSPTNLTVVGTPTYTGKYTRIGRQVTCIACIDSTTSTAATAGSTSFSGLPFTAVAVAGNNAGNGVVIDSNTVTKVGAGYVYTGNNRFYVSGWLATANIVMSFTYFIS